jgi:hypothetical protein
MLRVYIIKPQTTTKQLQTLRWVKNMTSETCAPKTQTKPTSQIPGASRVTQRQKKEYTSDLADPQKAPNAPAVEAVAAMKHWFIFRVEISIAFHIHWQWHDHANVLPMAMPSSSL